MKWICFSSQSGREISELSSILNRVPDVVITNKSVIPANLQQLNCEVLQFPRNPTAVDYDNVLQKDTLITLHGWLRIVPSTICNRYAIYNGHPGLINYFPQLKGKDPQLRAWQQGFSVGGSVVHRVTPEIDEGEIITFSTTSLENMTLEGVYEALRKTSIDAWKEFLKGII